MQALGTIEVVGLVAGIEAADVACKAANVELVGYELAKGGGYVTVKVLGNVGAVKAAVDAAADAANRITRVVSKLVIPRPSDQIERMVANPATVGYTPPKPPAKAKPAPKPEAKSEAAPKTQPAAEAKPEAAKETTETPAEAPAPAKADSPAKPTTRRKQA